MEAQLVVCDQITMEEKHHVLGRVLNSVAVPVFPYIVKLSLLLKISGLPQDEDVVTELHVVNGDGEPLNTPAVFVHRNYRDPRQVPGVDQNFDFTLLVEREENIFFSCIVNGESKGHYPIHVRIA